MTAHASLAELRDALPAYARDTLLNLGAVVARPGRHLTEQQHWGAVLACAAAQRSARVTPALAGEARPHLSTVAADAALGAAALMATSNVYFRARHVLPEEYDAVRAGLRAQLELAPGVPRADFELWCTAVSALGGCDSCVRAHESSARSSGATPEAVNDALRIAAVVAGLVATLDAAALT